MAIQPRLYTIDEFERFIGRPENQERLFQLIEGEIVEKIPTQEHGLIVALLLYVLTAYALKTKSGLPGAEVRYQRPEDRHNSRLPDVSFDLGTEAVVKQGSVPHMPSLAVEIQSPDDTMPEMRAHARYYLAHGSKMVWLVYPSKQLIEVFTRDSEQSLTIGDILRGGDALPGFETPVADIFADPRR